MKAAFIGQPQQLARVWEHTRPAVEREVDVIPGVISVDDLDRRLNEIAGVDVIFSAWGMPALDEGHLQQLPNLKAVFYAAGSVKSFAEPLLRHGVRVFSSWRANAVPVAEFCLAHILLGCKGYLRNASGYRDASYRRDPESKSSPGVYGETVALIGFGAIARKLLELLHPFRLRVVVVPFLEAERERLADAGIETATIDDVFREALVVSNHMANLPVNQQILTREHFASMRPNAVFINSARGAQVDEQGLIEVFRSRPDLTAVLDVTHPEPPHADSALYTLPNVWLSTHIAGSMNDELQRMAEYALDSYRDFLAGRPSPNEVTLDMLPGMA